MKVLINVLAIALFLTTAGDTAGKWNKVILSLFL